MPNSSKAVTVKLKIKPEYYRAIQQFTKEKGVNFEDEMSDFALKLYKKHVPAVVRDYIEKTAPLSFDTTGTPPVSGPQEQKIQCDTPQAPHENGPNLGV